VSPWDSDHDVDEDNNLYNHNAIIVGKVVDHDSRVVEWFKEPESKSAEEPEPKVPFYTRENINNV